MGFNRKKGLSVVAILIILVIINIVAFLFFTNHTITFWLGYGFATLACILVMAVMLFMFDANNCYQTFLRLPLPSITWFYFVLQMGLAVIQMMATIIPYLPGLIANCCLTGFCLVLILSAYMTVEGIENQEEEVTQKILFLENIQVMLRSINVQNADLASKIERLAEDFQFSDPISHSSLSEIEKQIEAKVVMLKTDTTDIDKSSATVTQISNMLQERNMKCKMLKHVKEEKTEKDNSGVKYVTVAVGVMGAVATIILTISLWIVPNNKYQYAMTLYKAERYSESIAEFEKVKGFRKSEEMVVLAQEAIVDTVYKEAQDLLIKEQYEEAIIIFSEIGDYKDSKKMIALAQEKICDKKYWEAKALLDNQRYDEAILAFQEISNYKDSKDMILLAQSSITADKYNLAEDYFNKQNYVEAIKLYKELGDFKDANQKIEQINNRLSDEEGIIYFGTYNGTPIAWQVVKAEQNKLMLISKNVITELPYNNELKNVVWGDSSLCNWLNTEFIISFSDDQVISLINTEIDGVENKVFLLSEKEFKKIKDKKLVKLEVDWWLCTKKDSAALFVEPSGKVNKDGENVVRAKGVRPCIWVSLEE